MKKSVAIIGGGPAALMLAATLDSDQFNVTIYERNFAPARKFLVAGDGGFNLTHSEELEQFISRYTPANFLETCLREFTNQDLQNWLKNIGIETFVGSSKRVFPIKEIKPIDVLNAILNQLKNKNVEIKTKHEWKGWNNRKELIFTNEGGSLIISADIIVFSLGGKSWSKTGSDGQWADQFKKQNIELIPFEPSNCAFQINWTKDFLSLAEGQPLKNISAYCEGKEKKGELVITKFGIEGGAVYALSPQIRKQLNENKLATVFLDLKPQLTLDSIKTKLASIGTQLITNALQEHVKLTTLQIALLKSLLTKEDLSNPQSLAEKIKHLPLQISGIAPIDESISTVGGVALQEVDENFQLKKFPHQYVIGEMLDWDAPTGGYLLQACFSMGHYVAEQLNQQGNSLHNSI